MNDIYIDGCRLDAIQQHTLKQGIDSLLDNSPLNTVISCATRPEISGTISPRVTLLHVRFNEDKPQVDSLARFLWKQSITYALSRRRRIAFHKALQADPSDISVAADIIRAVREVFITFRRLHPSRASEVGEVLAYCIAVQHLQAAQIAAKMSLKTSSNMPIHGLDGIHAVFENNALTIYFLESKLSKSANDGAREYAESVAGFLKNEKQYLREYELVGDLGNLDQLEGEARELALQHFDIINRPELARRERSVGVVCYSEIKHFANTIAVTNETIDIHEKHFVKNYALDLENLRATTNQYLEKFGANPTKCMVFFVAVPDVNILREKFYAEMGINEVASQQGTEIK